MNRKDRAKMRKRRMRLQENNYQSIRARGILFPPTIKDIKDQFLSTKEKKEMHKISASRIAVRKLKQRRKKLGLSQADLSKKAGIPQETISRIETGKQNATLNTLQQIVEAMECMIEINVVEIVNFD